MEFLCFGTGRNYPTEVDTDSAPKFEIKEPDAAYRLPILDVCAIEKGKLVKRERMRFDALAFIKFGIEPKSEDFAIAEGGDHLFISTSDKTVTSGRYLFSVNGAYQFGEMRLLPDGKVYLIDDGDRFEVDLAATEIHGKVVSVLERC